jgi:hypothetical protein
MDLTAGAYLAGSLAFCVGTGLYYLPETWTSAFFVAAALYTAGASLYLAVDASELARALRAPERGARAADAVAPKLEAVANALLSVAGTACYVCGSIGFFPPLYAAERAVGDLSYVVGSVLVVLAQAWKVARILVVVAAADAARGTAKGESAQSGVDVAAELSAGLGALCWLVGAVLLVRPLRMGDGGGVDGVMLGAWMLGSCLFLLGALALAYKPALLRAAVRRGGSCGVRRVSMRASEGWPDAATDLELKPAQGLPHVRAPARGGLTDPALPQAHS